MKRLIPILLLLCLLAGCSGETDYLSVRPYVEDQIRNPETGEPDTPPVVSSRMELRGAILTLIDNWKEQGTILIRDYQGNLQQNLREAMDYATKEHPTGAYAVDYADSEILEENGQQYVKISIVFRRSPGEIRSIVLVDNNDAAFGKILGALTNLDNSLTLRIRNYEEEDLLLRLTELCMDHPCTIPCVPQCSVRLYPDSGEHRIMELHFTYPESKESMRAKLQEVQTLFASAQKRGAMGETPYEKAAIHYHYLVRRNCILTGTIPALPVYSMLADSLGHDLSLASFYDELCDQEGVNCSVVIGSKDDRVYYWNFLDLGEERFHVDLRRCLERGDWEMIPLYDEDLLAEGYTWDMETYTSPKPIDPSEPTAQEESMISVPFGNG